MNLKKQRRCFFFNPNTGEFQVTVGTENSVRGPRGDGWQALVHLHPNPENVITFRLPAPADVWGAIKAALRTGSHTEFVQSTRPDGRQATRQACHRNRG